MRRHLCAVLTGPAAAVVEQWRHTWDPAMAAVAPAHVTVTYPEEVTDESLLSRRAEAFLGATPPFRLRLGEITGDDHGKGGVFIAVEDIDGGWSALRRRLLAAPMTPVDFPPHVTVAHPRTSHRGAECHTALAGRRVAAELVVREILHTATTADRFTVLRRFPLSRG